MGQVYIESIINKNQYLSQVFKILQKKQKVG